MGPGVEHLVVPLLVGDDSGRWYSLLFFWTSFSASAMIWSFTGVLRSSVRERQARAGRFAEPEVLHPVQQRDRLAATEDLVAVGDDALNPLLPQGQVAERHLVVQDVIEDDPPHRGLHHHAG